MSAYTVYQELFPPQTVEQVETSHFTSADAINLVVAKASLLQIYEFVEYVPEQSPQKPLEKEEEEEDFVVNDEELASERLNDNEDVVKYSPCFVIILYVY
jgi:cleavage and polyadenylation specificity factor subunit 1